MTYNLTFFLTSLPILLLSVSAGPTLTHDDDDVQGLRRRPARGAVFISPPAAAAPLLCCRRLRWLPNEFSVLATKCRGNRCGSHNEKDPHLNIIIKANFKRSNDAELIKTSCNDERGCRRDGMLFTSTQTHRQGPAIRIPISYSIRWVCNDALY